jgi:hypothetical protein
LKNGGFIKKFENKIKINTESVLFVASGNILNTTFIANNAIKKNSPIFCILFIFEFLIIINLNYFSSILI